MVEELGGNGEEDISNLINNSNNMTEETSDDSKMIENNSRKKSDEKCNKLEKNQEEIESEAKAYRELKPKKNLRGWNWRSPNTDQEEKEQYIISKRWLKVWKAYVGLYYLDKELTYPKFNMKKKKHPGTINEDILKDLDTFYCAKGDNARVYDVLLKEQLSEQIDYKILPQKRWNFFYTRYGGVELKRSMYPTSDSSSWLKAEVYFLQIELAILPQKHKFQEEEVVAPKPIYISKRENIGALRERIQEVLSLPEYNFNLNLDNFRLWKLSHKLTFQDLAKWCHKHKRQFGEENKGKVGGIEINTGIEFKGTPFDPPDLRSQLIDKSEIGAYDILVIERADSEGNFVFKYDQSARVGKCEACFHRTILPVFCRCKEVFYCSEHCRKKDEHYHINKCQSLEELGTEGQPSQTECSRLGQTGLQNLGNTCFMNAGLQCLSSTMELVQYFLQDKYIEDLNPYNTLGTKGKLANAFGRLMRDLWYSEEEVVSPWLFKRVLSKFQPMFSGHMQHDSQELISYILDGLHEDLNRVKYKLYIERADNEDPNDNTLNKESWNGHLKRNQSIIVDLMHGQFKSTIHCPECHRFSVTFDPFNSISVPIKEQTIYSQKFYFLYYDAREEALASAILIEKTDTIELFREKVAKQLNVEKYSFVIGVNRDSSISKLLCRKRKMKTATKIGESAMFLHQVNPIIYNSNYRVGMEAIEKKQREEEKLEESKQPADTKSNRRDRGAYHSYYHYNAFEQEENIEDDDDFNNGLTAEVLRTFITLKYPKPFSGSHVINKNLGPTRMLTLLKTMTCVEIHHEIFKYFKAYLDLSIGENQYKNKAGDLIKFKYMSTDEAFGALFPKLDPKNWEKSIKKNADNYPYVVRLINKNSNDYKKKACYFCKEYCTNCYLPYTEEKTLGEIISNIPGIVDNSEYFNRESIDCKKNVFELESVWNINPERRGLLEGCFQKCREDESLKEKIPKLKPTLYECLDQFVKPEKLEEKNEWYCSKCKKHIRATKQMQIFKSPPILIIHLKRFKTGAHGISGSKINTNIHCPTEGLDLSSYILSETQECKIYDLYAVVQHEGSMGFGHYIAYAKSGSSQHWTCFEDSHVLPNADPLLALSPATYVLFYRRRDLHFVDINARIGELDYAKLREEAIYTHEEMLQLQEGIAKLQTTNEQYKYSNLNNSQETKDGNWTYDYDSHFEGMNIDLDGNVGYNSQLNIYGDKGGKFDKFRDDQNPILQLIISIHSLLEKFEA